MKIELQNLFLEKVKKGINLFTGAGFSTLKSPSGKGLPTGKQLCSEVIEKFGLSDVTVDDGLAYISEFCPEQEYQNFLRTRFTVEDYNPLYNVINKINIKTYVTTNIDNIIKLVIDNSPRYYLKNIREYGASMNGMNELSFIPLHGDVYDLDSKLYFGAFDLSVVDKNNGDLFKQMYVNLAKQPILFMGYGFQDKAVLSTVKELFDLGTSDIWIQFLPSDQQNIKLFKSKGCHIIEADTFSLLKWLDENLSEEKNNTKLNNFINDKSLINYLIPSIGTVANIPRNEYFQKGITGWHPILADVPYERKIVAELEDVAIKNKNVVLIGSRFSGKTTILMQLARKVSVKNKFFVNGISKDEAEFIINKIGNEKTWIFFKNCTDDIIAYNKFTEKQNITVIGTSDEYRFETVKHLLDKSVKYSVLNCSDISKQEAQLIYNKIPIGIRRDVFKYKETQDEKYSMLEMVAQNVKGVFTKKQISKMLRELKRQNQQMFTTVALASYLSENGSAISYSNVAGVLNIKVYPDAVKLVQNTKNYLRTYNFYLDKGEKEDFFVLRSKLFAINVRMLLIEEYKLEFAEIIKKFTLNESQYNIAKYDVFRRKAYDAEFFSKLYKKEQAVELYKDLYKKDNSPYTLQQLALCLANFKDYEEAFLQIDKAISRMPNNFSFKNSQAIIMFESNKSINSNDATEYMRKAMKTLQSCYVDDKRKIYHAQKFAEFAIYFYENLDSEEYLQNAWDWILEMTEQDASVSRYTLSLKNKLSRIRERIKH